MIITTVIGVLKYLPSGGRTWAGYIHDGDVVPAGTVTSPVQVIDLEDGTGNRWVISHPEAITHLDSTELDALLEGEISRAAKAKLTDEELAALGLTRD